MKIKSLTTAFFVSVLSVPSLAAQLLEHVESEAGSLLPGYTGIIASPFNGVAAYGNGDGVEHSTVKLNNAPGVFRIDLRGASSATSAAGISIYVDGKKVGAASFSGTAAATKSVEFNVGAVSTSPKIKFLLETDSGANDTFLDWYELYYVGQLPAPLPAPVLPLKGAFETGVYRNMFVEAGYSQAAVTAKVNAAYNQLFHSTSKDKNSGEAIFIDAPNDPGMAYIWDTGNNDVRSEGMSYGMMMAVQMDRKDDFDKLWAWANKYSLNKTGEMKGYFGWQKTTAGGNIDSNPAPDGEEYFAMALFFASNRWGDGTGIYNYRAEANKLLDNMISNGQTHYVNSQLVSFSLFDPATGHILFSPYGTQHTDPSYHLPGFYELWARWADRNNDFWAQRAIASRAFLKSTVNSTTGLNPDYANFDGSIVSSTSPNHKIFAYDAWRTISNAANDYAWWKADAWQVTYAKNLHSFLKSKGVDSYASLYELNGQVYSGNTDHSPGLVAMNAVGSLASNSADAWDFVNAFWNTPVPTGQYRYYDGSLYMLGLLAVSGNYRIYCPNNGCGTAPSSAASSTPVPSSVPASSVAPSSKPASSVAPSSAPISSAAASSPAAVSSSANVALIGRLEAENYAAQSGIQTEATSDTGGGLNIGYINSGDYVEYQINVPAAGTYKMQLRVASGTAGGAINVVAKNAQVGSVAVNGTGGWQNWVTASINVNLAAGAQTLRLNFTGGSGYLFNLNWMDFSAAATSSVPASQAASSKPASSAAASSVAAGAGLNCQHVIVDQWSQGYTAAIRVTNTSTAPISGWSVNWRYSDGSVMTNSWNANVTGSNPYAATPLAWLNTINPGQTVEIGIQGSKGIPNGAAPTAVVTGPKCN